LLGDDIRDFGIDVLRIDYNLDPLAFWQGADAPDRQGMTENQYVQGLYTMWDELRSQYPGMFIDDCASGGRRIDLETISRSVPLWRSDLSCSPSHCTSDQAETAGLSLWIPLHTAGLWAFDPYTARSVGTTGAAICSDLRDKTFQPENIKRTVREIKELRDLWLGDYYPLTPIGVDESAWMAWQFDRPDLGRVFAVFFRRPNVAENSFTAALRGLNPTANYEVRLVDAGKTLTLTGKKLASFKIDAPTVPSSVLMIYRKL
jgi:alpha-galactosidase